MTDNEFRDSWNFSKMVAINIGSVTLSKEDVLAIDDLMNRQKAEIERFEIELKVMRGSANSFKAEIDRLENSLAISKKETKRYMASGGKNDR